MTEIGDLQAKIIALEAQILEIQLRNERLCLSNRMLRDKLRDLVDLLADFGVYETPFQG